MSKDNSDRRLKAFNDIVAVLSDLDDESKAHVLDSACSWFGLPVSGVRLSQFSIPMKSPKSDQQAFPGFAEESDLSPKEFLHEKSPQTNVERVTCLGYFLTHYRDTPHFKTVDISKLNTEAAQPKFSNPAVAVNDASKARLLVASTKGHKQISAMGEQFVIALPDREAAKGILKKMKPKKRMAKNSKKKTTPK